PPGPPSTLSHATACAGHAPCPRSQPRRRHCYHPRPRSPPHAPEPAQSQDPPRHRHPLRAQLRRLGGDRWPAAGCHRHPRVRAGACVGRDQRRALHHLRDPRRRGQRHHLAQRRCRAPRAGRRPGDHRRVRFDGRRRSRCVPAEPGVRGRPEPHHPYQPFNPQAGCLMTTSAPGIESLQSHASRLAGASIAGLLKDEPGRVDAHALRVGPLYATFARQRYDAAAWDALLQLARQLELPVAFRRLFDGEKINLTEGRSVLHTALRGDLSQSPVARQAYETAAAVRQRMYALVRDLEASDVTDIVSVGIGGSDLGPRLVADALRGPLPGRFRVHFISNVDGAAAQRVLAPLDPKRTAAVFISKTFGTQETLLNGAIVRDWLGGSGRIYAVSANPERAASAFDIAAERVLPMWDWVGGRYSLWSAVGFPIALAIGTEAFDQLLAGAAEFDRHVLEAPLEANLAVRHGLTAVWNRNALGLASHAVLTYDQRLALLPAYLQQLVMESLGKRVKVDGSPVDGD